MIRKTYTGWMPINSLVSLNIYTGKKRISYHLLAIIQSQQGSLVFPHQIIFPVYLEDENFLIGCGDYLSLGLRSGPLPLSSSSCLCNLSCSFFSLSSTSRSLAAVSTGLAPPKMEADRLEVVEWVLVWSSSFGTLRGFRFNLGLWGGPEQIKPTLYSRSP